jgi:hypothetical protein
MPFPQDKKEIENPSGGEKKIEFSQKLPREDLEGTPSPKGGDFDFLKMIKTRQDGEAAPVKIQEERFASEENSADKEEFPVLRVKNKNWLSDFAGRLNQSFKLPLKKKNISRVPEVNLVKGEIVRFFDWQKGLLIILISVFASMAIVSVLYWGISWWGSSKQYAQNSNYQQQYYEVNREIKSLESQVKEVLKFKEKLDMAGYLLARHIYWTNFFNFLENNTLSNVYFSNFSGGIGGSYTLAATTDNLDAIDAQIKKLLANPYIKQAGVSSGAVSGGEGKPVVTFTLPFSLDPKIFLKE